ncbi:hypothetical protein N4T20_15040 [Flavobacterium sp. TR2]|uniref:hypothetical protein n=1 Tax=Flavobacterium sp. TR2 TaxID=2977321 RepID=UPI0021B0FB6B|nr:hypothetical protein [Flavobacterium sp. TR2]UWY27037.1 hypothetical protein N4T20_15040 [Flavobacterium sp. TR2]
MKTRITLFVLGAALFHCCQKKDWTDSNENSIDSSLVRFSNIDDKTVKKWLLLDKQSDSIMKSAKLIIDQQNDQIEFHPQDERQYIGSCIDETQQHLDRFKNKVQNIRIFVSHIEDFDPALEHTLDSLKQDCIEEKLMLDHSLSKLR